MASLKDIKCADAHLKSKNWQIKGVTILLYGCECQGRSCAKWGIGGKSHLCERACSWLRGVLHPLGDIGDAAEVDGSAVGECDLWDGHNEHSIGCWS